jgi:hypothetical protein
MFDPYRKWLGIPEDQRPPTHYQLLGISPDEQDLDVIEAAVLRQSSFVRNFQAGPHADEATRILNEIASARLCLVDRRKRAKYNAELAKRHAAKPASHSSARHSDLAIDVGAAPAARPVRRTVAPAPRQASRALDLDQLLPPATRRAAAAGRQSASGSHPALGRRRTHQTSIGYIWQVPLLTVIVIILMLAARTIGRTIAEQRAAHSPAAQAERSK